MPRKADPRRTVLRFLRWLEESPKEGECCQIELQPLETPSVRIRNVIAALRDPDALALFWDGVFELSEAALALGIREAAVLDLVAGGKIRGLHTGGDRWLLSRRRIAELAVAARQREHEIQALRAAEQWFTAHGYKGLARHGRTRP